MDNGAKTHVAIVVNAGSSSVKFGVFNVDNGVIAQRFAGGVDGLGTATARFQLDQADGVALLSEEMPGANSVNAFARIAQLVDTGILPQPDAIAHRIVHGGAGVQQHCLIDAHVMAQLDAAVTFAPLHLPAALDIVRESRVRFPDCPQIACLDTAFHADMPLVARTLPLPLALRAEGIVRYGFHGLSCESILRQLGDAIPSRLVIAHLGSGASVTAVGDGRSIDTSMGLTPIGGVVMATRSGDLDPGVLLYLMRQHGLDAAALESMLNHDSGMRGISCLSGDMRVLRAASHDTSNAQLAIAMFIHSVRKQIAAMAGVLGGIDLLVFTGGIGEHDAQTRADICSGLGFLGLAEAAQEKALATSGATLNRVRVIKAAEELQMTRHVARLLGWIESSENELAL